MIQQHIHKFDSGYILKWFYVNSLKSDSVKFQFMILGTNTNIKIKLFLDRNKIEKSQEAILLEITIDNNLSFKMHIDNICQAPKYKLHALQHIRKYLSTDKTTTLWHFISSQFYHTPLIWDFAWNLLISRVQKIYFRSLQVCDTTYDEQLSILLRFIRGIYIFSLLKSLN